MKMLDELRRITDRASTRILEIYNTDFSSELKSDQSPVTPADHASHETILEELSRLDPGIPILSEESDIPSYETRSRWTTYWLVDPLDGTKGFIDKSGQFTVNIALVDAAEPVLGVVAIPVRSKVYCGDTTNDSAFVCDTHGQRRIGTKKISGKILNLVESRHHPSAQNSLFNQQLRSLGYELRLVRESSSLKYCAIAEGNADVFLRVGPTSEWDVAAAQAVLTAAGGKVCLLNGAAKRYNQSESLINPPLLSFGDPDVPWFQYVKDAHVGD